MMRTGCEFYKNKLNETSNLSIKIPNRNNLRIEPLQEFDEKLLFDDNPVELLKKPPYR